MNYQDFFDGNVFDAYKYFGAHMQDGGVIFRVYAPNAKNVEVIGEFNCWNGQFMDRINTAGVYELFIGNAMEKQMYKYRIHQPDGAAVDRSDPYGFQMELRPQSSSIITDMHKFNFDDEKWMKSRDKCYDKPMNIYEVHLGSWQRKDSENKDENTPVSDGWYTYRETADKLIPYVKEHGYTHIEVLPLSEHPADCSWGYQTTGFFSATSRYGTPDDLKYLINECHKNDIGIIMDFVPVHFAVDGYALVNFDGTSLYEYPNNGAGYSEWGSYNFNYYRNETRCFMQSCANFWLSEYHFDGIRMDAISNAIYWQGDASRGVNNGAVEFLRKMNSGLHHIHPTAILIAEDSTNFLKVTAPSEYGGLGFDYKWDMGWMNDTLDFFRTPPFERQYHYHKLTFSMHYFYNELFLLPFSHDEVVHGKATIIQKMWGLYEDKFKQARALYLYMYTHPGKKLNFMGNEIAQFREWDEEKEQDWFMTKYPAHDSFRKFITDLSKLYIEHPALHCQEYNMDCFKWLEADAPEDCIYAYKRFVGKDTLIVVMNLSDHAQKDYVIGSDMEYKLTEIINSDSEIYSGTTPTVKAKSFKTAAKSHKNKPYSFNVSLEPFSAKIFKAK